MKGKMKMINRKNLYDKQAALEIIPRASMLTPVSQPEWGSMIASEMLHYCSIFNKLNMAGKRDKRASTMKKPVRKLLALYLSPVLRKT